MQIANLPLPTSRKSARLNALFVTLIYLSFGTATPASAADWSGMAKLAEMAAIVRHADECPAVPKQWSSALATLLILHTPTEQRIQEQERQVIALRNKIGKEKWCTLYATEMEEAYIIFRTTTEQ